METKFTKGDWFIDSSTDICTKENIIGNVICLAPDICCEESLENWPANARLISAAPDMFNALVELLAQVKQFTDGNIGEQDYFRDEISNAKKAIKKATE